MFHRSKGNIQSGILMKGAGSESHREYSDFSVSLSRTVVIATTLDTAPPKQGFLYGNHRPADRPPAAY
jgi:hypothetical protein